jgi:hypothetical protein
MKKIIIILSLLISNSLFATDTWDYSIPNVSYLHRTTNDPYDIHVMIIDLKNPGLKLETVLAQDKCWGREVVSAMANRHGAQAAMSGDFCSLSNGIPQGITVRNDEILVAPKYRTAIGFTESFSSVVGMWTDRWNWYAKVIDQQNNEHDIVMMNLDCNQDWLCLYTDKYGTISPGSSLSNNVVEVVVGPDSLVTEIRQNQSGITIPAGYYVLTGREQSATWLTNNITVGERLFLDLITIPDWHNLWQAISGGPRIVQNGLYYADPIAVFPGGEDFTLSYKNAYYNTQQPRASAGITINGDTLILAVVDGRQPSHSIGMTLQELANLLIEFGAYDGLQFDSGGSATFFFDGSVRNQPSDGQERAIANSFCVFSTDRYENIAPQSTILDFSDELLPDFSVTKLIDGDRSRSSGKWADVTSDTPWVELDLGEGKPVTHFQLFHSFYAGDPDYLNTVEFYIYTRNDTTLPWNQDFYVLNDTLFQSRDNLCTYSVPQNVRYVRLEITQCNYLSYEDVLRQPEFEIYILDTTWAAIEKNQMNIPDGYKLYQNYPNPFNPRTNIQFSIPRTEFVTLKIYNLLAQEVATLVSDKLNAGNYTYTWDAGSLASGVYLYKLQTGNDIQTKKMILLR